MLLWFRNIISVLIYLDTIIFFSNADNDLTTYEPLPGEVPFLISLTSKSDTTFFCTAVLITRWHSLTSCSCLTFPTSASRQNRLDWDNFLLIAGLTILRHGEKNGQKRKVRLLVVHPGCKKQEELVKYDLGMAISSSPFHLGKFVLTAKLPFRLEAEQPFNLNEVMVGNSSKQQKTQLGASLVYWSREDKANIDKVKVLRMIIKESVESGYFRIHKEKKDRDRTQYTRIVFQSKLCPDFDEAAFFSDDQQFFGIVSDVKRRFCDRNEIMFTRVDYVLEWIVHVISKGSGKKLKPSITVIILLLLHLKM